MSCRAVSLQRPDDFDGWRQAARRLLADGIPPGEAIWHGGDDATANLFGVENEGNATSGGISYPSPRVPASFIQLAETAALHRDHGRFSLLYRLLWRLQAEPALIEDQADEDVRRLHGLARTVRRDIHKMRAFVRFRRVDAEDGERFVAWFEPEHHILRANAQFFVNRFAAMAWDILTPQGSLHWDGEALCEGPPASRAEAPAGDAAEDLWRRYYASTFNPARLKLSAMLKEMPRRYWHNMPETALIPGLVAGARGREAAMVAEGADAFAGPRPASLGEIAEGIATCRRCPIGCNGTRAVAGEGRADAGLMIVGEQPGDMEEQAGRPFVGPAGQLLRSHLASAGIDTGAAWLTNAVKHFKYAQSGGKRRLHQNPSAREIDMCRWWVESERQLVRPRLVLALGASAARAMLGRTVSVQQMRGRPIPLDDGAMLWITTHPSYLLRLGEAGRVAEEQRFAADLRAVASAGQPLRGKAARSGERHHPPAP